MENPTTGKEKALRHYQNALSAERSGNLEQALTEISKAFQSMPQPVSNVKLLVSKSDILRQLQRYDEALVLAREAAELKPEAFEVWLLLAMIFFDTGKYEEAAAHYKKTIFLKEDFSFYTSLANAEIVFDPKAALEHAERALELNPAWDEALRIRQKAKALLSELSG